MTENQKAVLNLLKDKEMILEDIAVELHSCSKRMKNILANMEKSKWIKKDEDTDDISGSIRIIESPPDCWPDA